MHTKNAQAAYFAAHRNCIHSLATNGLLHMHSKLSLITMLGNPKKAKTKSGCCSVCRCWVVGCICAASCVLIAGLAILIGYFVITGKMTGTATDKDHAEWEQKYTDS
jgi:hypothetical protein